MADPNQGYNVQQAEELEKQNKKLIEQRKNLEGIFASNEKIAQIQAQELQNIVRIAELRGEATAELMGYQEASAVINQRMADAIKLQENGLTKVANVMRDLNEMRVAEKSLQERMYEDTVSQLKLDKKTTETLKGDVELQKKLMKLFELKRKRKKAQEAKNLELSQQLLEEAESLTSELENSGVAIKKNNKGLKDALKTYSSQSDALDSIKKKNKEIADNAATGAFWKATEFAGKAVGTAADMYGKLQNISADMYKSTGGNEKMIKNVQDTFTDAGIKKLAHFGLGFEEISESMVNLSQRSAQFAMASQEVQSEVALTTAKLERLGVSSETSSDLFNTLRLNFGFQAEEFGSMADDMVQKSQAIGMTVEQYTQDFQSSFPILSQYGTGAVNVFDKLARQARASGMSVQELAQSMGQFDTFEGAAENASKLNFLLGSQLDTTELLMADEADRLDMIKGAFSPSQFQNMDKFKKKAIAAAAGFSDVGAFEKAMRGDVEGLGKLAKDQADDLNSATEKSTAATLAFSKGIENSKDRFALGMVDLEKELGKSAHTFFGGAKAAGLILGNLSSAATMLSTAAGLQMGAALKGSLGGAMNTVKTMGTANAARAAGGFGGAFKAGGAALSLGGKLATGAGALGAGLMVGKDVLDVGTSIAAGEVPKGEDIGGIVGGAIGGAIGMFGGPVGIALGAAAGNWIGDAVGGYFDKDDKLSDQEKKEAKEKKEAQEKTNALLEQQLEEVKKGNRFNKEKKNYLDHISPGRRNNLAHASTQRSS